MATPIYKGTGQPAATGGWLSGLGSWFGGPAPAYVSKGQSSGYLGGATPAYKPAPASTAGNAATTSANADDDSDDDDDGECREPERITVLIPRELIEPQQ